VVASIFIIPIFIDDKPVSANTLVNVEILSVLLMIWVGAVRYCEKMKELNWITFEESTLSMSDEIEEMDSVKIAFWLDIPALIWFSICCSYRIVRFVKSCS
jgi:hypothetical protein